MKYGKSKLSPVEKALRKIECEEKKLRQNAKKQNAPFVWKSKLEEKIPEKMPAGLKKAFSKGVYIIFEKGFVLIYFDELFRRLPFQGAMDYIYFRKHFRKIQKKTGNFYKVWPVRPEYPI